MYVINNSNESLVLNWNIQNTYSVSSLNLLIRYICMNRRLANNKYANENTFHPRKVM